MRTTSYFLLLILIAVGVGCQSSTTQPLPTTVIPQPRSQQLLDGNFVLSSQTQLVYPPAFENAVQFLKHWVEEGSVIRFRENDSDSQIVFVQDSQLATEGYKLEIDKNQIRITAATDTGAFYAVQSLRQLMPESIESGDFKEDRINIRQMHIQDEPKFAYRGMHLDVGRHFFSVDFIKQYLDYMAMLKMNYFHWHLTEDQGWRLEIKKYPLLQTVAAYRDQTLVGHYNEVPQRFDGQRYGGYYTQEEAREIVAYAAARHITVVPEIEMPGHSQAAITAYPELGCTGESPGVAQLWGVFEQIYCPKEETFAFLEDVLDEVMEIFPSRLIHIGGDEAPKKNWKACPACQARMVQEGLQNEDELQSYFIKRMESYLNSHGRQIIGWDEIIEGGLAPNATVMSWRGTAGAITAAKQGNPVIMTPNSHCYFDYYQSQNENEPLAIGGYIPLEKVYQFDPIPTELNMAERALILGAQANLWTEYISQEDQVEYMIFPRITALSEVLWTYPAERNYTDYIARLLHFQKRLDALDVQYANHLFDLTGELVSNHSEWAWSLQSIVPGVTIHYTTDGTAPNIHSPIYQTPIPFDSDLQITAAVFEAEKQLGAVYTQELQFHKAVGKPITVNVEANPAYAGNGTTSLINGVPGSSKRYGDREWLGYWGDDLEVIIDLQEMISVNQVSTRLFDAPGQWIYAPAEVWIELLDAQKELVSSKQAILHRDALLPTLVLVQESFEHTANYVVVRVKNYGTIPDGAQGAGHKAWTFIDEIIVR